MRPLRFDYTCSVREAETAFVFRPQMRDLNSVFRELTADTKATRNFIPTSSLHDHPAQRRVGYERRGADRISRFFVGVVVLARDYFAIRRTLPDSRVSAHSRQAIRLVAEKDVRDFFHQRGAIARRAVRWIQDDQAPAVRQRL